MRIEDFTIFVNFVTSVCMKFVSSISNLANFLSESEEKCFSLEVGKKFQQLQDHILG